MDWFDVLELCKGLGKGGAHFKPAQLQEVAQFETSYRKNGKVKVTGLQRASSWCAQLVKMKMLEQAGVDDTRLGPGRPGYFYRVTEAAQKLHKKPLSKLDRILLAINRLKAAQGRPEEGKLYAQLFEISAEVERELPLSRRAGVED